MSLFFISTVGGEDFDCDFQDGFCGWSQSNDDDTNWAIEQGSTDTSGTGPAYDRTQGNISHKREWNMEKQRVSVYFSERMMTN